ncbi:NAD-P-binding protein [Fomitopsis serialis]|uniref:NAD-P-binding protein n=1 Tax=Fomitopsis serialis TaxID=139415 RepID=UPI0020080337|nr:NAD-P-binding protein [Neoantrodia serialis]KAH9930653.1 NAD-P-binding protein [Neoantrodia serialis]
MPSYVVIGGSRDIGLELVRQLAANADNIVFATVRNKTGLTYLNELVASLTTGNIHVLEADVVEHSSMKAIAADAAETTGGSLDVLIHNAARTERENIFRGLTNYEDDDKLDAEFIESMSYTTHSTLFKVNVRGAIHAVNAFLPLLRKGSTKKIAIIGSEGGTPEFVWKLRLHSMAAYGATKSAEQLVMTKYAALLEPEGFTVVAIDPGLVDVSKTTPEKREFCVEGQLVRFEETFTNHRIFTPEEAVDRVLSIIGVMSPKDNASFWSYLEFRKKD